MQRDPLLANLAIIAPHCRCITHRVGCASEWPHGTRQVVINGDVPSHPSPQAKSCQKCLCPFPPTDHRITHKDPNRQHSLYVLHQLTSGNEIALPMRRSNEAMELVHLPQSYTVCSLLLGHTKLDSGKSQSQISIQPQVGDTFNNTS